MVSYQLRRFFGIPAIHQHRFAPARPEPEQVQVTGDVPLRPGRETRFVIRIRAQLRQQAPVAMADTFGLGDRAGGVDDRSKIVGRTVTINRRQSTVGQQGCPAQGADRRGLAHDDMAPHRGFWERLRSLHGVVTVAPDSRGDKHGDTRLLENETQLAGAEVRNKRNQNGADPGKGRV